MKLFGKKMDERERMEMYQNEHYAFWILYAGMAIGLIGRGLFLGEPFSQHVWEWLVFFVASLWLLFADFRRGNYDCFTKPGWRSYLLYASVFSVIFTVIAVASSVYKGWIDSVRDACLVGVIEFVFLFALTYASVAAFGELTRRRRRKLEESLDDEE